jgi:hypothetical protein
MALDWWEEGNELQDVLPAKGRKLAIGEIPLEQESTINGQGHLHACYTFLRYGTCTTFQ